MKILITIIIIAVALIGWKVLTPELEFYPEGTMGNLTPFYSDLSFKIECHKCGKPTTLYKIDSKNRVWCNSCFREVK